MITEVLSILHSDLSDDLDRIRARFKPGSLVTLVVRQPERGDASVVLGNDDLEAAIEAIREMQQKDREGTCHVIDTRREHQKESGERK